MNFRGIRVERGAETVKLLAQVEGADDDHIIKPF